MTPVVFRKFPETGKVIALFPEECWYENLCNAWVDENMHGADYDKTLEDTVPANKQEYQRTLLELKESGYLELEVATNHKQYLRNK